ncbi:MAG: DUF1501 domain-containing protein [Phycisphaerales bacterium]
MRFARTDLIESEPRDDRVLVVVFLRGGADGLTLVPPYADDAYYSARPALAVPTNRLVRLDDRFGLHEALSPLRPIWDAGALRIVHGAGTDDTSHSHFEAQDYLEHGGDTGAGWIGRWLRARAVAPAPLAAIAIGTTLPESLRGAPSGVVLQRISDFRGLGDDPKFVEGLERLYAPERGDLGNAARAALDAEARLRAIRAAAPTLAAARYPDTILGRGLREIAQLVMSDVGLTVTTVDAVGGALGWDTHFVQSEAIRPLMDDFANSIAAFREDLGAQSRRVTIVAMTEFGRRVAENTSLGTDHGSGSVAFVIGDDPPGGAGVECGWRSLERDALVGPGDVPVTTELRTIIGQVLAQRDPMIDLDLVFPRKSSSPVRSSYVRL